MEIKSGQVVEIVKHSYVVVASEVVKSEDRLRGDYYYAHHFKTIPKEDFLSGKENIKEKTWTIKDLSSMHGPNEVCLKNIKIVDKVNFKKETIVKYVVM